jgi:hypothetical protein
MWFEPPERNTLRLRENGVVFFKPGIIRVSLSLFFFLTHLKWRLPDPFIAQGRTVTTSPKARHVASRQVKPYAIGHHRPGVANDIFNDVGMPSLVVCLTAHGQQYRWAL